MSKVSKEEIDSFLNGSDPMERIIKIECGYDDNKVSIIYRNEEGKKMIKRENFFPFVWTKESTAQNLFDGNRKQIKLKMSEYGIGVKSLRTTRDDGSEPERMKNGYKLMFYAKVPMTYSKFMEFFKKAGRPIYPNQRDKNYGLKEYICVAPNEQYMIQTGRRLFKGYDDYDDLLRMEWDLETEGLDPEKDAISQIGIRTNKGYEKILTVEGEGEEKKENEFKAICEFFEIIKELQPDVITGHNTENFDWNFVDVRLKLRGVNMGDFTLKYFRKGVYKKKKQQVLKLGGEMEYFYPTVMWGTNLTDSLFAVRRAMAINSNIKSANLKYITKFTKLNKENRVYVPGKLINTTWEDLSETYAFNNIDGEWFKVDDKRLSKVLEDNSPKYTDYYENNKHYLKDNSNDTVYEYVSGRYIVQRYLLDDLWETDKVELTYNQSNYLVSKMLPVSYEKVCTMGTAAIWKYIMLGWSYEHNLAVPEIIAKNPFVGGLSRLLAVGHVSDVVKLDYNSLYPSIILTYNIDNSVDIMDVLLSMLEYILSMREHYKDLKGSYGKKSKKAAKEAEKENDAERKKKLLEDSAKFKVLSGVNDTLQLPFKILGNSYFGGASSGTPFPWTDTNCQGPEQTTCTGRQMLRLMIGHFSTLSKFNGANLSDEYNYKPIVGDSFTPDTPLFIKYKDSGLIDIKPISELINEDKIEIDVLAREYDYSPKEYYVLCRSGWVEPSYIYRHRTTKPIYKISDNEKSMCIDVTEDHSLFNSNKEKIKPSQINSDTKLEYYADGISNNGIVIDKSRIEKYIKLLSNNKLKAIPTDLLNATIECKKEFLDKLKLSKPSSNKTLTAGIMYLKNNINNFSQT